MQHPHAHVNLGSFPIKIALSSLEINHYTFAKYSETFPFIIHNGLFLWQPPSRTVFPDFKRIMTCVRQPYRPIQLLRFTIAVSKPKATTYSSL